MSDQSESITSLDLVHRSPVKNPTDDHDDPSKDLAHLLDGENAERTWSLLRALSSPMNRETVLLAAGGAKPWCYIIIMPDLDAEGFTIRRPDSFRQKWFIKFGDSDPGVQGRYGTHNPSFSVQVNTSRRRGTELKKQIFTYRAFKAAGQSSEWFAQVDRRNNMKQGLKTLFDQFLNVDFEDFRQETDFIDKAKKLLERQ